MKNDDFLKEKLEYEDIEVPDELLLLVRQTVAADRQKKAVRRRNLWIKSIGSIAAMLLICLGIGVNSSYSIAKTAVKIPVVNSVAKAVIVRSYKAEVLKAAEEEIQNKKQQPIENPTQPEEEITVIESDNEAEEPEIAAEEPVETVVLQGQDAWKEELTPEGLKEVTELYKPEMEKTYAETPEKLKTVLLAELPEQDIYLYGYHEKGKVKGVVLRVAEKYEYFDWVYMNATGKLPELFFMDLNGDRKEEVLVHLYNEKIVMEEVSKDTIQKPEDSILPEQDKKDTEEILPGAVASEKEKTEENVLSEKTTVSEETIDSEKEPSKESVSGNDIKPAEKEMLIQTGELWAISLEEQGWKASLLSANDYESQILHQLKADCPEKKLQLYLMEEPFGNPMEIKGEENTDFVYEGLYLCPEKQFIIQSKVLLRFKLEAAFKEKSMEETDTEKNEIRKVTLEPELEADVRMEDDSFVIENIRISQSMPSKGAKDKKTS